MYNKDYVVPEYKLYVPPSGLSKPMYSSDFPYLIECVKGSDHHGWYAGEQCWYYTSNVIDSWKCVWHPGMKSSCRRKK